MQGRAGLQKVFQYYRWGVLGVMALLLCLAPFANVSYLIGPRDSQTIILQAVIPLFFALVVPLLYRFPIQWTKIDLTVVIFFAFWLVTSFTGHDAELSLRVTAIWLAMIVFYFCIRILSPTANEWKFLFLVLAIPASLIAIGGIAQLMGYEILSYRVIERRGKNIVTSTLGNPNYVGSYLAPAALLIGFTAASLKNRVLQTVGFVAALICTAGLILTVGKAAILSFFLGLFAGCFFLIWRFLGKDPPWKTIGIAVGILTALVAGVLMLAGDFLVNSMTGLITFELRVFHWMIAANMISDFPITGLGPGIFPRMIDQYYVDFFVQSSDNEIYRYLMEKKRHQRWYHLHNEFIEILTGGGIILLTCFLAMLLTVFNDLRDRLSNEEQKDFYFYLGIGVALLCILTDSFWGFPLQLPQSALLFWLSLAAVSIPGEGAIRLPVSIALTASGIVLSAFLLRESFLRVDAIGFRRQIDANPRVLEERPELFLRLKESIRNGPYMDEPNPYILVDIFMATGQFEKAVEMIDYLGQYHNLSDLGYSQKGSALQRLRRLEEAAEAFRMATILNPQNHAMREYLAFTYLQNQQLDLARSEVLTVLREEPERANCYYILALIEEKSDPKLAAPHYLRALRAARVYTGRLLFETADLRQRLSEIAKRASNS